MSENTESITRINRTSYVDDLNKIRDHQKMVEKIAEMEGQIKDLKEDLKRSKRETERVRSDSATNMSIEAEACRSLMSLGLQLSGSFLASHKSSIEPMFNYESSIRSTLKQVVSLRAPTYVISSDIISYSLDLLKAIDGYIIKPKPKTKKSSNDEIDISKWPFIRDVGPEDYDRNDSIKWPSSYSSNYKWEKPRNAPTDLLNAKIDNNGDEDIW